MNAIEWAASAMEMSAIGAKNVANAAHHYWLRMHGAALRRCDPGQAEAEDDQDCVDDDDDAEDDDRDGDDHDEEQQQEKEEL